VLEIPYFSGVRELKREKVPSNLMSKRGRG